MPLELTDEDRAAIERCSHERFPASEGYLAGLAAGIERSAKVCDTQRNFSEVLPMREPEEREYTRGWRSACWGCAATIRALWK